MCVHFCPCLPRFIPDHSMRNDDPSHPNTIHTSGRARRPGPLRGKGAGVIGVVVDMENKRITKSQNNKCATERRSRHSSSIRENSTVGDDAGMKRAVFSAIPTILPGNKKSGSLSERSGPDTFRANRRKLISHYIYFCS